jgi:hypothetical protein
MTILEDQMANDIQQSTLIVLEGSGLYIELDLMVFGTIELILVGSISYVPHNNLEFCCKSMGAF